MNIQFDMPEGLELHLKKIVLKSTQEALEEYKKCLITKEWFSLKEACEYVGVSNVTFNKFRKLGLKIVEIDNVKRVSRKEIDRFLIEKSY